MKKLLTVLLSALLLVTSSFALVACNNPDDNNNDKPNTPAQTDIIYTQANTQFDALTNVSNGDADVAVVDASFLSYFKSLNSANLSKVDQSAVSFTQKSYSFAVKKDSNVTDYINAALYKLQEDGTLKDIATSFHVADYLAEIPEPEVTFENLPTAPADSEWANILKNGYLRVGLVYDEGQKSPFLHMSQYGSPDGFDIKVLVAISELFGLNVTERQNALGDKFLYEHGGEVTCNSLDQAFAKIDGGEIDIIINRMDSSKAGDNVDLTDDIVTDTQVVVVNGTAPSFDSLKDKKFTAGKGSAGETVIKTNIKNYFFN